MIPSIIARIFYMGLMFLAGVLLAAVAKPHDFGSISIIILNATLFYTLSALGSESAIMLSIGKKNWSIGKSTTGVAYSFLFQLFVFSLFQFMLVSLFRISLLTFKTINLLTYEFLYFIGLLLVEKYTILFYSYNRAKMCNTILASSGFLYLVVMLAFYNNWLNLNFHPFQIVSVVTLIQGAILMTGFHILKGVSFEFLNKQDWKGIFTISVLVLASNLVQLIAYRFDYWFMESTLSTSDVGIYAQANRFAQLIWALPNIVSLILIPRLFKKNTTNKFIFIINALNAFNLLISIAVLLISTLLYKLILPVDYIDGLYLLFLMLPGYFLFACTIPIAAYFSTQGQLKLNLYGSIICLTIIVFLDIILIPNLGYWGAALANLIAYSVCALYLMICLKNNLNFSFISLLKLRLQYSTFNEFK
jgi:O-antigen/teichoic acid export membrane protein